MSRKTLENALLLWYKSGLSRHVTFTRTEAFRVCIHNTLAFYNRKRRIERRLAPRHWAPQDCPIGRMAFP